MSHGMFDHPALNGATIPSTPAAITAAHTYIRKQAGPDTDLMLAMVLGVPQNGATT